MKKQSSVRTILFGVVLLIAFWAAWPLFTAGFLPTHDGEYHLIRFWEFEKMLGAGNFFPRWAVDLNSGYGVPLFNFHYPLPNYLGVIYHTLGFSLVDSFKLVLATGYLGAVIFCFSWLMRLFSPVAAALGTIVFAFIPYWFVDIYIRGSVGETLAFAWVMLALLSLEKNWIKIFALSIGLLILTHNILAMIFLPLVIGYLVLRRPKARSAVVWGIGLAAYFWLPAILEQKYVVGLTSVNFRDYFPQLDQLLIPSWGSGFSGTGLLGSEMSPQIGIVPLVVIITSIIFVTRKSGDKLITLSRFFFLTVSGAIFLMLPFSRSIWEFIAPLAFIQYPWRLLSLLLPSTAFLTAYLATKIKYPWWGTALAILAVILTLSYTRPVMYPPRADSYYLARREFTDGTSSMGNTFSTRWTSWQKARAKQKVEIIQGEALVRAIKLKPLRYDFLVDAKSPSFARVNTLYYPGWQVSLNHQPQTISYEDDGLIKFALPAGNSRVTVKFGETPLRCLADFISLSCLFWFLGSTILNNTYARSHRHFANPK